MVFIHHCIPTALRPPKTAAPKVIQGSRVIRMPIASSIPWTGNGLWASNFWNPASRTCRAALISSCGVRNSATIAASTGGGGGRSGW